MPVSVTRCSEFYSSNRAVLVLGDRERCLRAGMDDHITSTPSLASCSYHITNLL